MKDCRELETNLPSGGKGPVAGGGYQQNCSRDRNSGN
jgi:hypothetical protein